MSRHVYFVPHLLKITFTSPPVYFTSSVLCIPFKVTFTSDHVYFASRLPRPRFVASLPLYVTFTSHLFTSQHVYFPSRSLFFPFAWLHVSFSSLLLCVTFTSRPVCSPSRSRFAPFIFRHVHFASRELASRSLFPRLPLLRSPHVPFS